MIEQIMDDYDKAYGLKSVRLRYFNVAGAEKEGRIGEWHDIETHLIPNILNSTFGTNKVFEMYGNDYNTKDGTCIRDYINIEDLINAHVLALEYLIKGGKQIILTSEQKMETALKKFFHYAKKLLTNQLRLN